MKILSIKPSINQINLPTDHGLLSVQINAPNIFHIRYTFREKLNEYPSLIILPQPDSQINWSVDEQTDKIQLKTAELQLLIHKDTGAFTWLDITGKLLVREPERGGKQLYEIQPSSAPNAAKPVDRTPHSIYSTKLEFEFSPDEAIYGLGQHEEGILNYRGHTQYLYQNNMKIAMPVLLSTHGWGMLFDSYSLGIFHDDQYGSYYWADTEDEMEFYFIYGPSFDRIVAGIRQLTGKVPMLPRWAYGFIQSKERYKSQEELIQVVKEYRKRRIPLDGIVQDWQYWDEGAWGQKSFDEERYYDPKGLMDEIHKLHAHAMISVWPNFGNVPHKQEFMERNLLLPDNAFYNVFDPAARALHWKQMNEGIFQPGFDGWWCDSPEPYDGQFFYEGKYRPEPWERVQLNLAEFKKNIDAEYINVYSLLNSQGVYEGQRAITQEKRVVNLTRSAFPGQQHYGTIVWSGDTVASWETLRWNIPGGLNLTSTGLPGWTLDIGGFFVKDHREIHWFRAGDYTAGIDDLGFRELYLRWFQYATFLPMFRSHGTDIDREIFRFGRYGDIFFDTLVKFDVLRYRLLPYIYSLAAWETHLNYTMLRLLAFDFPDDLRVHNITDQFMFGPSLLVCPVTEPMVYGANSQKLEGVPKIRRVYLPAGCNWYDFWTGQLFHGGQEITAAAPLDIIPLFVRAGSILPMGPVIQYADENPHAPIEVRVYAGTDSQFEFYEDEGDSYRYEQGTYAWTTLQWDNQQGMLMIGDRRGSYPNMTESLTFNLAVVREGFAVGVNEVSFTGRLTITSALEQATQVNKRVILEFGATWCPDCVILDQIFEESNVKSFLQEHFVLVNIDVNNRYRNRDIVEEYGNPIAKGIPSIVVMDSTGKILADTHNGELANARDSSTEEILEFLERWASL
jgi:alpha-D-xyloside xylohydrolase